jgi:hypothetical protein
VSAATVVGAAPVIGDGTTARTRARSRWRRARWPFAVVGLMLLTALLAALPEPRTSTTALAPDNPQGSGARAVAQVLQRQGVTIDYVRTTSGATAGAVTGTTLLVTSDYLLGPDQIDRLAQTGADLVLLAPNNLLDAVTDAARTSWAPGTVSTEPRTPQCADADAQAAGTISGTEDGFVALGPSATVCFPAASAQRSNGAYLVVEGSRRITAFADAGLVSNARITDDGNAALVLRALGRHEHLTWYVPSLSDTGSDTTTGPSLTDLLPPVAPVLALELLLVSLVAGVWRARRLGRVVTEPLPVTVRSAETTRGRGRLYRRSRSYGHAAAALRAGTATRAAARVGLPRTAGAPAVIDALARATGRPSDEVAALLYGPPPTDDVGLAQLARRLDELESEVHRS